jgi:hypothetical protein
MMVMMMTTMTMMAIDVANERAQGEIYSTRAQNMDVLSSLYKRYREIESNYTMYVIIICTYLLPMS